MLEYWLVDPERDCVIVWRRQTDGSFPRIAELSGERHDVLTTPLLAELTRQLDGKGAILKQGTLIDATLIQSAARRPLRAQGAA